MKLVVGLGNPGSQYENTRHNLGFKVCDLLSRQFAAERAVNKFSGRLAEVRAGSEKILLLWPETFMNLSGRAVAAAINFYQLPLQDVLIVSDDFNLLLAQIRLRCGGSHGGHNGIRSIIQSLGQDGFCRLRMGIGPLGKRDAVSFCLNSFPPEERSAAEEMIDRAARAAEVWIEKGIEAAMNQFNAAPASGKGDETDRPATKEE